MYKGTVFYNLFVGKTVNFAYDLLLSLLQHMLNALLIVKYYRMKLLGSKLHMDVMS